MWVSSAHSSSSTTYNGLFVVSSKYGVSLLTDEGCSDFLLRAGSALSSVTHSPLMLPLYMLYCIQQPQFSRSRANLFKKILIFKFTPSAT